MKRGYDMKSYETPYVAVITTCASDVITASLGDTPIIEWVW